MEEKVFKFHEELIRNKHHGATKTPVPPIPAFQREFTNSAVLSTLWQRHVNSYGRLYFVDEGRHIIMGRYPDNLETQKVVERVIDNLLARAAQEEGFALGGNMNLVVFYEEGPSDLLFSYYFVDHEKRVVFWAEAVDLKMIYPPDNIVVESTTRLGHAIAYHYWFHLLKYPSLVIIPRHVVEEVHAIAQFIEFANIQASSIMSGTSVLTSYTEDMLRRAIENFENMKGTDIDNPHLICQIAQIMVDFALARFKCDYGEPAAIFCWHPVPLAEEHDLGPVAYTIWVLLFFMPQKYLVDLFKVFNRVSRDPSIWFQWRKMMRDDWQEMILYDIIVLNANVAFLSINGVNFPAQIGGYVSTASALSGIIASLVLDRQFRPLENARVGIQYIEEYFPSERDKVFLALRCSMPFVFFIWALSAFVVALWLNCFIDNPLSLTVTTGVAWFVCLTIVTWCALPATRSTSVVARLRSSLSIITNATVKRFWRLNRQFRRRRDGVRNT